MPRYHLRPDDSVGICNAEPGNCPYGGDNLHIEIDSIELAQQYFDDLNEERAQIRKEKYREEREDMFFDLMGSLKFEKPTREEFVVKEPFIDELGFMANLLTKQNRDRESEIKFYKEQEEIEYKRAIRDREITKNNYDRAMYYYRREGIPEFTDINELNRNLKRVTISRKNGYGSATFTSFSANKYPMYCVENGNLFEVNEIVYYYDNEKKGPDKDKISFVEIKDAQGVYRRISYKTNIFYFD